MKAGGSRDGKSQREENQFEATQMAVNHAPSPSTVSLSFNTEHSIMILCFLYFSLGGEREFKKGKHSKQKTENTDVKEEEPVALK